MKTVRFQRLALAVAVSLSAGTVAAVTSSQTVQAAPTGVAFGAYVAPRSGETQQQAVEHLEAKLGTKLPMVREYISWDKKFGNRFHQWVVSGGRQMMISFRPRRSNGVAVKWKDIANAASGSQIYNEILALADSAKTFGVPLLVAFHHEPEAASSAEFGTSAEFVAAWRKIVTVFRSRGVTNVKWVWTMTSYAFAVAAPDARQAALWYPGDTFVDYIGADPYNWNQCRGKPQEVWEPLATTIEPMMRFSDLHPSKKLVLAEFGSDDGAAGAKAKWIDDVRALLKTSRYAPKFAAIFYFHNEHAGQPACAWWADSSADAAAAVGRLATDSFYRNVAAALA